MALLFREDPDYTPPGVRKHGFPRYREVLEGHWKQFFLVDLLTLAGMLPFALGVGYAVLSRSLLVLLPAAAVGGTIAGPALSCTIDYILRALRDSKDDWWTCCKKAWRQDWRGSLLPGAVWGVFVGIAVFMAMLLYGWAEVPPTAGTLLVYFASLVLAAALFTTYWPQLVLFEQRPSVRLKNCVLFTARYLWRVLGVSALQVGWWTATALILPWSGFLVPFLGVWVVLYVSLFLLYEQLDEAYRIEEQLRESFPEKYPEPQEDR